MGLASPSCQSIGPGEYDRASIPGFTLTGRFAFQDHTALHEFAVWGDIGVGVDEYRVDAVEVLILQAQDEQAGLGRDGDLYLLGHLQTAASLPVLFGHQDLQVAPQPGLFLR